MNTSKPTLQEIIKQMAVFETYLGGLHYGLAMMSEHYEWSHLNFETNLYHPPSEYIRLIKAIQMQIFLEE